MTKIKKTVVTVIVVLVLLVLLIPVPRVYEDGGSIGYRALLYEVVKLHELGGNDDADPFIEGIEIKVLGMTVYRKTDE